MPASLGPGLRTVSGAKRRRGGLLPSRADQCHLLKNSAKSSKNRARRRDRRRAIAVAEWASKNNVPKRTAQRWASEPKVRAEVEAYRRRALDRAVGLMSKRATWAADADRQARRECRVRVGPAGGAAGHLVRHDGRLRVRRASKIA